MKQRVMWAIGVPLVAALVFVAIYLLVNKDQPKGLQEWVESQNHVLLAPPNDRLMPGDIISLPLAVPGSSPSGQMQILYRAASLFGEDIDAAVTTSSTSQVRFTDSIDAFARSGALASSRVAEASARGHRNVEVVLTNITVEQIEHSRLEDAIALRPGVLRQLRAWLRRSPRIYVVNSVIRAKYHYRFGGTGQVAASAFAVPATENSGTGPAANGQFDSSLEYSSERPMVIGYSLTDIHLPDEPAGAPPGAQAGGREISLTNIPVEETRSLQPHASAKLWPVGSTIEVGFLDGDETQQLRFRQAMQMWLEHANLSVDYVAPAEADIRISFADPGIAWSFIGTDALTQPSERGPTMMAGGATAQPDYGRLLHEIGHALGLVHEFYNPHASNLFTAAGIADYARLLNISEPELTQRIQAETGRYPGIRPFDLNSVMHPPLPESIVWQGRPVRAGNRLSQSDRRYIRSLYPFDPGDRPG